MLTPTLPGFRFEVQAPPLTETLPRMDVAVFVGFAASGPLHLPVAVEDASQFAAIFGAGAPLAWDARRGRRLLAHLGPAVRAFFRNGGRRCWVIRVAKTATTNQFPLPGLVQLRPNGSVTPAWAQARSPGSWADGLQVGTALLSQAVEVKAVQPGEMTAQVRLTGPNDLLSGDLLRLSFAQGFTLLLVVDRIEPVISSPPSPGLFAVRAQTGVWLRNPKPVDPPLTALAATAYVGGVATSIPLLKATVTASGQIALDLGIALSAVPPIGAWLNVTSGPDQLWVQVQDTRAAANPASPSLPAVSVAGPAVWVLGATPSELGGGLGSSPPSPLPNAEKLTFELWVREGQAYPQHLSDLAFAPTHPRFWANLPGDQQLYDNSILFGSRPGLWAAAAEPRFPLAGPQDTTGVFLPLLVPALPSVFIGPDPQVATPLERDGLADFGPHLFLDRDMVGVRTTDLLAQADFLRYQSPSPRALTGIHAALGIEEATIIAVPDAMHRGWTRTEAEAPAPPLASQPLPHPEWWRFLDCDPPPAIPLAAAPQRQNFLDCGLRVLTAPALSHSNVDPSGSFTLTWSPESTPNRRYVLEEAAAPDFSDAIEIYSGEQTQLTLYGRGPGDYYFRVRVEAAGVTSDWSNEIVLRVPMPGGWEVKPIEDFDSHTLLAVQWSLLRLCAARGDMLAVLSLPEHYLEDDATAHAALLSAATTPAVAVNGNFVAPLGFGEGRAFSFGALYHPWLVSGQEGETQSIRATSGAAPASGNSGSVAIASKRNDVFRSTPPDGAACGLLAARALARGAWVAPANVRLADVVALSPNINPQARLDLQQAQINLVRQEPEGFLALSAATLSPDADLRPINVRRLLSLLRRLALRQGAAYVFEPNNDLFRRTVQQDFEALLRSMFVRGAFAGNTPQTSFQVVATATPQDIDQGRFVVDLKVAPSLPLTFVTIRLVQTGVQGVVSER